MTQNSHLEINETGSIFNTIGKNKLQIYQKVKKEAMEIPDEFIAEFLFNLDAGKCFWTVAQNLEAKKECIDKFAYCFIFLMAKTQ